MNRLSSRSFVMLALLALPLTTLASGEESTLFGDLIKPNNEGENLSLVYLSALMGNVFSDSPETLFAVLLQLFNIIILNVALAILAYYLIHYTATIAATGEFLRQGIDSALFVRIATGLALLIVLPSGYSAAQIGFGFLIQGSVGLADKVWAQALDFLEEKPLFLFPREENVELKSFSMNDYLNAKPHLDAVWDGLLCSLRHNASPTGGNFIANAQTQASYAAANGGEAFPAFSQLVANSGLGSSLSIVNPLQNEADYRTNKWYSPFDTVNQSTKKLNLCFGYSQDGFCGAREETQPRGEGFFDTNSHNECGQLLLEPENLSTYSRLITAWLPLVGEIVQSDNPQNLEGASESIESGLRDFIENIVVVDEGRSTEDLYQRMRDWGWIVAGFYYNQLYNSEVKALPEFSTVAAVTDSSFSAEDSQRSQSENSLYRLANSSYTSSLLGISSLAANGLEELHQKEFDNYSPKSMVGLAEYFMKLLADNYPEAGNPFVDAMHDGRQMMTVGSITLITMVMASILLTLVMSYCSAVSPGGYATKRAVDITLFLLALMVGITYVQGSLLAVVLPLIPVIIFVAGVIGWIFAVVEALIAAPIVALGILWPKGGDPLLGRAQPAVALLLNVFMRPALMIIGLFSGMIMVWLGFALINLALVIIQDSIVHIEPAFGWLVFGTIYTALLIAVAKKSFSLIYELPDRVLMWLGESVMSWGNADDLLPALQEGSEKGSGTMGSLSEGLSDNASQQKGNSQSGGGSPSASEGE